MRGHSKRPKRAHSNAHSKPKLTTTHPLTTHHPPQILHAYVAAESSFSGLPLDAALRRLLARFRLPGEAQQIDRVVEAFAARYCADCPGAFPAPDAAYLLAFAVVMLNTDAHHPAGAPGCGWLCGWFVVGRLSCFVRWL